MQKNAIIAIVAAVVVAVALGGTAVYVLTNDAEETNYILVEDQYGEYFWVSGSGETYADVIKNVNKDVAQFTYSENEYGMMVSKINGLEQTPDYSGYWAFYVLKDDVWTYSDVGLSSAKTSDSKCAGLFYVVSNGYPDYAVVAGGPENVTVPSFKDKVVYNGSTDGTVFTIVSSSKLTMKINGQGKTLEDAFTDACKDYKIPFKPTINADNEAYGIDTVFTLAMESHSDSGHYWGAYWSQYHLEGGAWVKNSSYMNGMDSADYPVIEVVYETYDF